jgi:uncharacterized membrane protein required for colicin V production
MEFLGLSPHFTCVVAFLTIFITCVLALILIGKIIKKVITLTMLGWLDRLCGGAIGAIKAFFLGWIFVIAVSALPFTGASSFFRDSPTFSFFVTISPVLKTQILRSAKMRAWEKTSADRSSSFSFGDLWLKFKSMGKPKYSIGRKEPVHAKHPPARKDVL